MLFLAKTEQQEINMIKLLLSAILFTVYSTNVYAHHSFAAEFDGSTHIHIRGLVTKVEWTNPHTYFYMENEKGETWAMEMGSPNGLMRRGWTRDTLAIGTEVIVEGSQARDGSLKGNAQSVTLAATCQKLFAGTSQSDFVETKDTNCK